jgi:NADH dehydrogenase FAD-containing subunit
MANVVIVGGGFGGIVVAESLAKKLGDETSDYADIS